MDKNKKHWEENYWQYVLNQTKIDFEKNSWLEKNTDYLKIIPNRKVLDLGSGLGQDSLYLNEAGYIVTAVDINEEVLKILKKKNDQISIKKLDYTDPLPFENNTYGMVNANMTLHYFDYKQTRSIFSEINRILVNKGLFLIRVSSTKQKQIHSEEDLEKIEENFYYLKNDNKYLSFFDNEYIKKLSHDFDIISMKESSTIRLGKIKSIWEVVLQKKS